MWGRGVSAPDDAMNEERVEMKSIDWNAEAVKMAIHAGTHMMKAHRGAMEWRQVGIYVIFGNDGYAADAGTDDYDPRAEAEVGVLRDFLEGPEMKRDGVEVLGFGIDPTDGYSWAMLVRGGEYSGVEAVRLFNHMVWGAWSRTCVDGDDGVFGVQYQIAMGVMCESATTAEYSAN